MITGLKDLDREILSKISDKELLKVWNVNKKFYYDVCDDEFLKRRLSKYLSIEKYKYKIETWKQFFIRCTCYILKLQGRYKFTYIEGDFVKQYEIFSKKYFYDNNPLFESVKAGQLSLIIHILKEKFDDETLGKCLIYASQNGHLDTVKYLIERKVNIHTKNDAALKWATSHGHYNIVKYLVESGAAIHSENNRCLMFASEHGHLEIVKYFIDKGLKNFDPALRYASLNGHLNVVKYLVEQGADPDNYKYALSSSKMNGHVNVSKYLKSLM